MLQRGLPESNYEKAKALLSSKESIAAVATADAPFIQTKSHILSNKRLKPSVVSAAKPPEEEKKSPQNKKGPDADWKKAILDELSKDTAEHKNNNEAVCEVPEFQTEYNRHRVVVAYAITRIYTYILGHLKSNCIILIGNSLR